MNQRVTEWETWQQAAGMSKRTIDERMRIIKRFIAAVGDPECATYPQIVEWLATYGGSVRPWSTATKAAYKSALSAWFGWLARMEYRADNPMVKIGSVRVPSREAHPVADEHLARLLATRMRRKTRVMILLCALAGLRVHEVAKVRGEEVDPIGGTITVRGKGGIVRQLPLSPILIEATRDMPARGWWFPSRAPEGHVQAKSVSAMIGAVMRRARIPGTAHSLRHTYATDLLKNGANLRTVQSLLRHASVATTQIYTQVDQEAMREAVESLKLPHAA